MSFGRRAVEKPRWLDEDELEEKLEMQAYEDNTKNGISPKELLVGGVLVVAVFCGTFFLQDVIIPPDVIPDAPPLRLSVQD